MQKKGITLVLLSIGGLLLFALTRKGKPQEEFCCPYCQTFAPPGLCFATKDELIAHFQAEHPDEEWEQIVVITP